MSNNILDEIEERLPNAHRYENYLSGLCVWHEDTRNSLLVYEDTYNCLACRKYGKTRDLLKKLSGFAFVPRQSDFHNPFTKWLQDYGSLAKVLKLAWENNKRNPSIYLRDVRKIPVNIQIELGIGQMENWITFPIRDKDGKIEGAVARAGEGNPSPSKYIVPSGQDPNLIYVPDWKRLNAQDPIYCTFGITDIVTLHICGVAGFSTTNGKRLSDLSRLDSIRKRIIFIPDRNEEIDAMKIAKGLGWRGTVAKCRYPDDCKDISDIFMKHPEVLLSALRRDDDLSK
jgi:hypothetical protein